MVFFNITTDTPAPAEEKKLATWGSEVPDDLVLDQKKLTEALKKVRNLIASKAHNLI